MLLDPEVAVLHKKCCSPQLGAPWGWAMGLLSWFAASLHVLGAADPRASGIRPGSFTSKGVTSLGISPCSLQRPCPSSVCFPEDAISRPGDAIFSFFFM